MKISTKINIKLKNNKHIGGNMDNKIQLPDGFIDLRINENLSKFRREHNEEYEFIKETKKLFDKAQQKFIGQTVTKDEMYLATSLISLNKLFQSAVLLFERGLLESGNIIMRSCLELSFKIVELIKNKKFINYMIKEQYFETKNTLEIINNNKLYDMVPKETVEDLLNKPQIKKSKHFKLSPYKLAQKNNLLEAYILYRLYCNDSHQSIATLNETQIFEDDGVRLNGNLRLEDFSNSIYMLISIVLVPFPTLIEKHSTDDELKKQYESLIDRLNKTCEI